VRHTHDPVASVLARRAFSSIALLLFLALPFPSHGQDSLTLNTTGFVGIGTERPARQLHLTGSNASFRMDRSLDAASFFLNRIDASGQILKGYQVGTSTVNGGEFLISDMGAKAGGPGTRRMTINAAGEVVFTGGVHAPEFVSTSSARYKEDVTTLVGASASVEQLRGVRFTWKDSGEPSLGLIAEEVAEVFPEVVKVDDATGQADAINYPALTAVLVEAFKEQRARLDALETEIANYRAAATEHRSQIGTLRTRVNQLEAARPRLAGVRSEGDSKTFDVLEAP
jgi:hypothetical protein